MSLEQKIEALTAAIEAATAALSGGAGAKTEKPAATGKADKAATTGKAEKTEKAAYEAKHTKSEALAAIQEVKVNKGVPAAKAIIKAVGFDKLDQITKDEDLDKLYELSKSAMEEAADDM